MRSDSEDAERELREQVARFSAFVRRTLRFWPSVPITLAVGALACVAFLYLNKPRYRSETVVLYSQPATGDASDSGAARNITVRLKELLMSRPKLERVIGEFDLYADLRKQLGMAEAVEELEKHVEYRAPGGDTFSIAFVGTSPGEAQRVTSRLAALVIEQDAELRRNQARGTRDFLVTEKAKTEATLREAERELAAFMAEHPRFALDVTPLATGAAIRATTGPSVATEPGPLTARVFAPAQSAPAGASTPRPATPTPGALGADSDVARATAAVAAARTHLAEQLERYTEAHPDVKSAAAALERAENRLATLGSGSSVAQAVPAAPAASAASGAPRAPAVRRFPAVPVRASREASPRPASTGDVVALETDWLKLTRAATQARQRLDQVEAAFFKADILSSSESGARGLQMTVIDPAYLPARPLPPGRTLIAAFFVAGSLLIGVFVAMLRAILDDRIFEGRDARGLAELLVEVPRAKSPRRVHVPG